MAQHTTQKPETLNVVKLTRKSVRPEPIQKCMLIKKHTLLGLLEAM